MADGSCELMLEGPKDSDVPVVEPAMGPRLSFQPFAHLRSGVLRVLAALVAVVPLAALAACIVPRALSGPHQTGDTARARHLKEGMTPKADVAEPIMWKLRAAGTGCANYNLIRLEEPTTEASADKCGARCKSNRLCTGFGYQSEPCAASKLNTHGGMIVTGPGLFQGACYLWAGRCRDEANSCWADYKMTDRPVDPTPEPAKTGVVIPTGGIPMTPRDVVIREDSVNFYMRQKKTGCSNWKEILLVNDRTTGQILRNNTLSCAKACWDQGCTGFGFMPAECSTSSSPPGSCFLWKGACKDDYNECWYDYVLQ